MLERGKQAAQRGAIEDELAEALTAAEVLGGAHGHRYAYIDLVIYDEPRAREALRAFFAKREDLPAVVLRGFTNNGQSELVVRERR